MLINNLKVKRIFRLLKKAFEDEDFEKCIEYSNLILSYDEDNLEALYYKSDCLFKLGDLDGALDVADIIIKLKPSCVNLLVRATFIAYKEDYDLAFSLFDEILDKWPHFEKALINKCYFLHCSEKWDEIIDCTDEFIKNNPDSSNAYDIKAAAYESKQDFHNALIYVNKALELDSNNTISLDRKKKILSEIND